MPTIRIVSWNINSIRTRLDTLKRVADALEPDYFCLQEIKVQTEQFPYHDVSEMGFSRQIVRGMKSYNGVAILSPGAMEDAGSRDWCSRTDARHVAARTSEGIELHNFYVPAGGDEPDPETNDKFAHKLAFLDEAADWSAALPDNLPQILVGDLNIAPLETDVWSHRQLLKVVSHTPVEVEALARWQDSRGWIDAVRTIIPEDQPLYSWWSYRNRSWPGSNRGRRLDHIWVSKDLGNRIIDAGVLSEARGWDNPSDHAPVWVDLDAGEPDT